jgi:hypothetical protein
MRELQRPVHSGFETLRLRQATEARLGRLRRQCFPANEQLTALALEATRRPCRLFDAGFSR